MTLPVVHVDGDPFDQGRQHGRALRERIAHNLEVYYDRCLREAALEPTEVRARTKRLLPLLESSDYFAAVQGVAEGSGFELIDIAMLNVRYELLYYQYSVMPVGGADGCTSFGLLPSQTTNGHLLIGENWDWIPEVEGALVHTQEQDFAILSFTEAGIVGGKIGLNSFGVGLVINGLLSTVDDWSRAVKPFHVRCYDILRSRTLDAARSVVADQPRACSTNFLLAQPPHGLMDIEAAPDTTCELPAHHGVLAHTNHFLHPAGLGVEEPKSERRPQSQTRLSRMRELLEARKPLSVGDLQACLRDHDNYPDSVCRHSHPDDPPEEACTTVVSAILDLDEQTVWVTDGPPCEHQYAAYSLAHEGY